MIQFICKHFSDLSIQQLYEIMVLRQKVFVVEQDCPYLDADGNDELSFHIMGYKQETLVAYTRLVPQGISYEKYPSIGRVVIAQEIRGQDIGKTLMKESIHKCEELFGKKAIKISAQCYLLKFYTSLGFEPVGEEYLEDGIPHIGMIKKGKLETQSLQK